MTCGPGGMIFLCVLVEKSADRGRHDGTVALDWVIRRACAAIREGAAVRLEARRNWECLKRPVRASEAIFAEVQWSWRCRVLLADEVSRKAQTSR